MTIAHEGWERDILAKLDEYARRYDFPVLNNIYHHFVSVDLRGFRSEDEWLLVFQLINVTDGKLMNDIYGFGNQITRSGMQQGIVCSESLPELCKQVALGGFRIVGRLYGKQVEYELAVEDLRRADIEMGEVDALAALRALAVRLPSALVLEDDAVLMICGRSDRAMIQWVHPQVWYHPDIADDELPSSSESLVAVARALARGTTLPPVSPREANLQWRRWVIE